MNTQKQNIFIEKDIEASQVSNIYGEMNTANENAQKIETSFNKKLKANKQEDLLSKANTDTNMNTTTETKTLTKGQIAYQKQKAKKEALKAQAEEVKPPAESDDEESDEEEDAPVVDTIPAPEPVADEEESEEEEESEDEEDEEEEEEEVVEAVDEKSALLKRLAELEAEEAKKNARTNIQALRTELKVYQQGLIDKARDELKRLTTQLAQIDAGVYDEELIAKHLSKSKPASKKSAPKAKGEKGEKKAPTYEGKGKKAGTGDAREKIVANLNSGKTEKVKYAKKVGTNTWSLMYEERKDGGIAVMKDSKGAYSIPVLKEVGKVIGVSIKTKQDYIDWVKK
jgi:hypothetical protein